MLIGFLRGELSSTFYVPDTVLGSSALMLPPTLSGPVITFSLRTSEFSACLREKVLSILETFLFAQLSPRANPLILLLKTYLKEILFLERDVTACTEMSSKTEIIRKNLPHTEQVFIE